MSVTVSRKKTTTATIRAMKGREKIVTLTAYDFVTAKLVDEAGVDLILVGDSLGGYLVLAAGAQLGDAIAGVVAGSADTRGGFAGLVGLGCIRAAGVGRVGGIRHIAGERCAGNRESVKVRKDRKKLRRVSRPIRVRALW